MAGSESFFPLAPFVLSEFVISVLDCIVRFSKYVGKLEIMPRLQYNTSKQKLSKKGKEIKSKRNRSSHLSAPILRLNQTRK